MLAAIFLAGCNLPGALSPPYFRGSYQPGETGVQATMPVVVRGNPFPSPDVDVAAAVVDAMQGHTWWPTVFVPATIDSQTSYRVVVLFSGPINMPYPDLCSAAVLPSEQPQPASTGPTPVSAALCKWEILLAAVSGTMLATSPDDRRFRSMMAAIAQTLFPLRNPDDAQRGGLRVGWLGPGF